MRASENQQIIISGVGGQGVLFITRLLAESAIAGAAAGMAVAAVPSGRISTS